jgi:hypothetical protein
MHPFSDRLAQQCKQISFDFFLDTQKKKSEPWLFVRAAHDMLYPSRAATRACGRELGGMRVQLPPCFVAGAMAQGCVWIRAAGRRAAARGLAAGAGMDMATQPKRRHRRQLAALPERQLGDSCFPCCAWAPRRPGRSSAVSAAVCAAAECALSVLQLLWAASGVLAAGHTLRGAT